MSKKTQREREVGLKMAAEFYKFENYGEVSSRISLPPEEFARVEAALKSLGITFRSPSR